MTELYRLQTVSSLLEFFDKNFAVWSSTTVISRSVIKLPESDNEVGDVSFSLISSRNPETLIPGIVVLSSTKINVKLQRKTCLYNGRTHVQCWIKYNVYKYIWKLVYAFEFLYYYLSDKYITSAKLYNPCAS